MDYKNYSERIEPLVNFETYKKPKAGIKDIVRISVKKGEMTTHQIKKSKFSQLNDKLFYFPNAIVSLPFAYDSLQEIDEYKKNKCRRTEKYFWTEKEKLLELEKRALKISQRIDFLNILEQVTNIVNIECSKFDRNTKFLYREELHHNILHFNLVAEWKKNIPTMNNSMETSQWQLELGVVKPLLSKDLAKTNFLVVR